MEKKEIWSLLQYQGINKCCEENKMYPLPTPIDLRKPEYKFVPEYSCVQIESNGLFGSLSPEAKTALIIGMGALAIGMAAFIFKKHREDVKKELTKKPRQKKVNVSTTRTNKRK
jgi:hypothetical protein